LVSALTYPATEAVHHHTTMLPSVPSRHDTGRSGLFPDLAKILQCESLAKSVGSRSTTLDLKSEPTPYPATIRHISKSAVCSCRALDGIAWWLGRQMRWVRVGMGRMCIAALAYYLSYSVLHG
jgi:hypothetical protein